MLLVIVVGVACAVELQRLGFDVVVLEAQSDVGGRCRTANGIDEGACWIHGVDNNPIIQALHRHNLSSCEFRLVGWLVEYSLIVIQYTIHSTLSCVFL